MLPGAFDAMIATEGTRHAVTTRRRVSAPLRMVRRSLVRLAIVASLTGCASLSVTNTVPLKASQLTPPGSDTISVDGYRMSELANQHNAQDMLVLVAFSGGGKRSAAFAYGALKGMRDVMIPTRNGPRRLLDELDAISGVSGGSFTAAYYGLYREKAFGRYENDFLYRDTNANIFGIYLLPWNWTWIVEPDVGTNDFMERVYDRTMFHGATYKDLQANGLPVIAIGATDLSYGSPFLFTQEVFDVICSDLSVFPLARAVAASNGFPGLFSAVTLTNRARECAGRRPAWRQRIADTELEDPFSRLGVQAIALDRYLDPQKTKYLHLADGGISDNLGLRVAGSMMQNLSLSSNDLTRTGLDRFRRILIISVDGQGAQDTSVARRRATGGLFSIFGLVSGGQIDRYNFESLITVRQQMRELGGALKAARCARGPVVDGAPCDDVRTELIHVALTRLPPGPDKDRLQAIPTGLTINRADVDLLVQAGQTAITTSEPLRAFLQSYPVVEPARARTERVGRSAPGTAARGG
jgi:NTE family protein